MAGQLAGDHTAGRNACAVLVKRRLGGLDNSVMLAQAQIIACRKVQVLLAGYERPRAEMAVLPPEERVFE
jgi:hypothetical protein